MGGGKTVSARISLGGSEGGGTTSGHGGELFSSPERVASVKK